MKTPYVLEITPDGAERHECVSDLAAIQCATTAARERWNPTLIVRDDCEAVALPTAPRDLAAATYLVNKYLHGKQSRPDTDAA